MASEKTGNVVAIREYLRGLAENGPVGSPAETREELLTTLEELRVAAESLEEQNRELSTMLEKVDAARDRYEELFALVPDACFVTDEHGVVEDTNEAASALFGVTPSRFRGKPLVLLLAGGLNRAFYGFLREVPEAPRVASWKVETEWRGRPLALEVRVSRDRHPPSGHRRLRWVVHDRSGERDLAVEGARLRREIVEAREADAERARLAEIGAVVGRIRHDLGNPLTGIRLLVRGLERKLDRIGEGRAADAISTTREITAQIRRLERILEELGGFSREPRLRIEEVDLEGLLGAVVRLWGPVAKTRRISLETRVEEGTGSIVADTTQLSRVLDNLVKNAIEAFGEGPGEIRVEARPLDQDSVRVSVVDSGPGLPEGFAIELFRSTKAEGSGLGLAVSRSIAEAHGGSLTFGRPDAGGTVFHLDLPRHPPKARTVG